MQNKFTQTVLGFSALLFTLFIVGCGSSGSGDQPVTPGKVVWAVGNADHTGYASVLRSDDGGTTWNIPEVNATMLHGFDAQNLYVASKDDVWVIGTNHTLVHTDDGGRKWEKISTFPDQNRSIEFYSISALSSSEFWISGSNGSVYHTTDSARHWEKMDPTAFENGMVQGIKAIDRLTVYAVGKPSELNGGFVVRTLDGGKSWEAVTLPNDYNSNEWIGVKATDRDHVVVYGGQGHYASTIDGGKTWTTGLIEASGGVDGADINDLVMLDQNRWWNAMDLDNIFLTIDGGQNWNEQNSTGPANMFLVGIDAADDLHAVIVGESAGWPLEGKILLTHDGGNSWTLQKVTDYSIQKVAFASIPDDNVTEETNSVFSSIIRTSVEGFIGGATGDIGGFVMGLILQELGWGTSGDDADTKLLKSMNKKLDTIIGDLSAIKNKLDALAAQLQLDMDDIKKNILDPTDAINDIGTTHDEFIDHFGDGEAGEENRTAIHNFIRDHIVNDYHIENDVNTIYHAINPQTIAKTPALTNFTDYVNDSYNQGYGTFTDAYNALELYTSQLIIHQLKGVNLVVESKHITDGNASVLQYMNNYQTKLHDMLGNPGNGESFIYNAYRLALMHADPLPYKKGESYLSDEALAMLKRADFYRLQATNSKAFGPRILVFETQDFQSDNSFFITNPASFIGSSEFNCERSSAPVPGKTYTFWDTNNIKPATLYNVYECSISDPINPGTYDILDRNPFHPRLNDTVIDIGEPIVLGHITVARYDGNYTLQSDGNFTYGHTTFFHRTGLNHFSHTSPYWHTHTDDMYLSSTYGEAPWDIGILGTADGEYEYSGHYELDGYFHYNGDKERSLYVDYDAAFHIVTESYYTGAGSSNAYAKVHFGIWDRTDDKAVDHCGPFYSYNQGGVNERKDTVKHPSGTCHFTAIPGHSYYVYFSMREHGISGMPNDGTHSRIRLEEINYLYLHF